MVSDVMEAQTLQAGFLGQAVPSSLPSPNRARWVELVDAHSVSIIAATRLERGKDVMLRLNASEQQGAFANRRKYRKRLMGKRDDPLACCRLALLNRQNAC